MKKRAFTLVELLVVVAIIGLLVSLLLPALAKAQAHAKSVKDSNQQKQIHTAMIGKANETKGGKMPTPGLVLRMPYGGQRIPGEGDEDYTQNKTTNLYSLCVAQQLFNTDILYGATEVNPVVKAMANYNYNAYRPAQATYWDSNFKAKIDGTVGTDECNTSYAHLLLVGLRKQQYWNNRLDSSRPHICTRGVKNGVITGDDYEQSPTLRLHGPAKSWEGYICFGDTHIEFAETFRPEGVMYACGTFNGGNYAKDNLFQCGGTTPAEFTGAGCLQVSGSSPMPWAGGDTMMGICPNGATQFVSIPVYDKLDNQ